MDIGISEQFKGRYDGYMLLKFLTNTNIHSLSP